MSGVVNIPGRLSSMLLWNVPFVRRTVETPEEVEERDKVNPICLEVG